MMASAPSGRDRKEPQNVKRDQRTVTAQSRRTVRVKPRSNTRVHSNHNRVHSNHNTVLEMGNLGNPVHEIRTLGTPVQ